MNELAWLQQWYRDHCNGQWEHHNGIEINTLDNPGWAVKIDGLAPTLGPHLPMRVDDEISETSWTKCTLEDGVFQGYSDPDGLERIIQVFQNWIHAARGTSPKNAI